MLRFFVFSLCLGVVVTLIFVLFSQPIRFKRECFKGLKLYYQSADYIFSRISMTEEKICEQNKQKILSMYQCFYRADVSVTDHHLEPRLTDQLAKLLAYAPTTINEAIIQFDELCHAKGITINQQDLDQAVVGLSKHEL